MSYNEWKEVKVSELGKVVTGKTPKTAVSDNYGGNIPFLTPSDDMAVKFDVLTLCKAICFCAEEFYYKHEGHFKNEQIEVVDTSPISWE